MRLTVAPLKQDVKFLSAHSGQHTAISTTAAGTGLRSEAVGADGSTTAVCFAVPALVCCATQMHSTSSSALHEVLQF